MRRLMFLLLILCPWSLVPNPVLAQESVQMVFEQDVAPDLKAIVTLVANPSSRNDAQASVQKAAKHARQILDQLDPQDPNSESAQILNHQSKGTYPISSDLAKILQTSLEVAKRLKEPLVKQMEVNLSKSEVTFKTNDLSINIEPLIKGYLADIISEDLNHDGWKDSFLELGGVFVTKGRDFNGSWKIPVIEKTTTNAQHAFYYKVFDVAAATVEHEKGTQTDIKSVTVFTEGGACKAQRLAVAAVSTNLSNAKKLLKDGGATRFVLIDQNGNFLQNP